MTNQQGAPEALLDPSPDQLRAIARTARNSSGSASDDCGPLAYVLHGWRAAAIAFRAQQAALVEAQQPAPSAAAAVENLRKALQFYADKEHFNIADEGAWDTVSGEPQNYWCDEEGTATVEDGTIARLALAGHQIKFEADASTQPSPTPQADSQPAPQGEPWHGHHFKEVRRGYWQCSCGKVIAEAASTASKGFYPSLPNRHAYDDDGEELFTAEQMRAYVDAARAPADSVTAPAESDWDMRGQLAYLLLETDGKQHPHMGAVAFQEACEAFILDHGADVLNLLSGEPTQAQAGAVPLTKEQRSRIVLTADTVSEAIDMVERHHGIKGGQHG